MLMLHAVGFWDTHFDLGATALSRFFCLVSDYTAGLTA